MANKIRFNIPGLSNNSKFNLVLLNMKKNLPQFFRDDLEIGVYGDFPPCIWSGIPSFGQNICDETYIAKAVEAFNAQGAAIRVNFANPAIREEHLTDFRCNNMLEILDGGSAENEVILCSDLLEEHIRTNFPNIKIISSASKLLRTAEAVNGELAKDYAGVELNYDLNSDADALAAISDKGKCIITVNTSCVPNCPVRAQEINQVGIQQLTLTELLANVEDGSFRIPNAVFEDDIQCPSNAGDYFSRRSLPSFISPDDVWEKLVPMGFNEFIIDSIFSKRFNLIETYMQYLVKPECRDEARFTFMFNLERNGLVRLDG